MRIWNLILVGIGLSVASAAMAKGIAKINGKDFTEKEFLEAVKQLGPRGDMLKHNPKVREQFLNHLIDNRLLSAKAEAEKVHESKDFKDQLASVRNEVLSSFYVDKYISDNSTPAKMKEYFEKNKKLFSKKEIQASHILMKEEKEAKDVLKKAQAKDADFAELAKKHSTGPSGPRGGDLGFFGPGRMVPEFEKAAFATEKGKIHPEVVKTQFGYHIIKVTDVKGGDQVKYDEVKDDVKSHLERKLREDLVEDLRKTAKVSVDTAALEKVQLP